MKNSLLKQVLLCFTTVFLVAKNAFAMHLSEGILPVKDVVITFIISAPFVIIGFKKIAEQKKQNPLYFSLVGLLGAAVFVISAFPIPVPVAGTCSHPAGTGLSAIFLGPFPSVVVSFIALLIQALFMAHGGLTTLGANVLTMGVCGSFCGYAAYMFGRRAKLSYFWSGFLAGFVADIVTYAATAFVLAASLADNTLQAFTEIGLAFVPTQAPLSILEGVITAFAVKYVFQNKPELLENRKSAEVQI
ncbi:MAG: hypothetical protein OHK0040_06370 [bacterium]